MRFVLFPSWIISSTDGERHFIKAGELAKLYNVPFHKCLVVDHTNRIAGHYIPRKGDVRLYARADGNYKLPQSQESK